MKKVILIALVLLLGAAGFFLYQRSQATRQAEGALTNIQSIALEKGVLDTSISATGKVRSAQKATLSWQTSGVVETVAVHAGDKVKAGDKLAALAQTSLPQSVIIAQSDLFNAQQSLDDLHTQAEDASIQAMQDIVTYEQAVRDSQYQLDNFTVPSNQAGMDTVEAVRIMEERLDTARQAFEPYKYYPSSDDTREDLLESLNEAQADYDAALKRLQYEYDLEVAQSNLKKAHQDYEKWKDGPDPAEIEAVKAKIAAAEATMSQAWIEAPFDGTITLVNTQAGDKVTSNSEAFRIDNLSAIYVDLQVSEVDIDAVETGQPVEVTFDAMRNKQYQGQVVEVAPVSDEGTGTVNFTVTVALSNPDADVRPGMTVDVEIVTGRFEDILLIPNQAVRVEGGKQVVYVLRPGLGMAPVEVTLGASDDTHSQLLSGDLQAGDQVVLSQPEEGEAQPRMMFGPGAGQVVEQGGEGGGPQGDQP